MTKNLLIGFAPTNRFFNYVTSTYFKGCASYKRIPRYAIPRTTHTNQARFRYFHNIYVYWYVNYFMDTNIEQHKTNGEII